MRSSLVVSLFLAGTALAMPSLAQTGRTAEQTKTVGEAAAGSVKPAGANGPQLGTFGLDTAGMDPAAKPGVDFNRYANGTWENTTEIPADRSSFGMFHVLQDLSLERTRAILEDSAKTPGAKPGDYYASFMDEAAIEAKGVAPVKLWLADLASATTKEELVGKAAKLQTSGTGGLFGVGVRQDSKAPDTYIVFTAQSGLTLPDRDYYLKDDPKLEAVRTAYRAYLAQLFTLAGEQNAQARADAVFAFEKALANAHWTRVESRDADKTYNKWTAADFAAKAPGYPWSQHWAGLGVPQQTAYIVAQPTALTGEAKVFADTPLPVLKDYYQLRVLKWAAPNLSKAFDQADFAFSGTVLSGTPQQQPRWKRGVALVSGGMGEEVGKTYVARYFPPEAKASIDDLVKNVRAAMGERLSKLEWMAPETKQKALAKLAAFTPKIGYPTVWRDYSSLQIDRGDLIGNVARASQFEFRRGLSKLGRPIDRTEWLMTPMTINAYANPPMNEIVFPAAILQPPFFDPKADAAINYGGIGAVIGHELSHHFDDQGRKYDPTGKLAEWWTPEDVTRFKSFTDKLVAQYNAYEPLPGQHVNGALTLGENIADLAGLTVAYEAYKKSLGGKPAPVLGGLTGDQRFYLGWAQVWRSKYREPILRQQLLSDPHSPGPQRVAIVRNLDPWYEAYKPAAGEALYLAPADRVRIW
jgi:putative endopeptidase